MTHTQLGNVTSWAELSGATRSSPQLQLGDSQRVVSMAAVVYCLYKVYDCPHNHGHKGVYLHVSLSMLNGNY